MTSTNGHPRADPSEIRALARGTGVGILGTALSQLSLFLIVIVIAARLGTSGVGVYSQAFAIFSLLSLVALLGMQTTLTRYVADGLVSEETHGSIRRLITWGTRLPMLTAALMTAALLALAPVLSLRLLNEPDLVNPLRVLSLAIPLWCYGRAAAAALQGFGEVRDLAFITTILEPGVRLALTVIAVTAGGGITGAALAIVVSNLLAAGWARHRLRVVMSERLTAGAGTQRLDLREVLRFTLLTSCATIATTGLLWADTIILGAFLPSSSVGVYQVATRILALATLGTVPIAAAFAPRIANLVRRQEWVRLRGAYSLTTIWSTRLAVPGIALCVVAPLQLAEIVGGVTGAATAATLVLALGKLAEAATGPCGMVLNMSRRVGLNAANNLAALVLNVLLNLLLIPLWGLVGAAVAWSVALVALNFGRSLEVWRVLDLSADNRRVLRNVLMGGPALGAGWLVMHYVRGIGGVPVAGVVIVLCYAATLLILDWLPTDSEVVRSVVSLDGGNGLDRGIAESDALLLGMSTGRWHQPVVRRWRWHVSRRPTGTQTITIDELISPLRLDVLVRVDFITFIREHKGLAVRDWGRFMALAREHDYYVWFVTIALAELFPRHRSSREALFESRVRRTLELVDSWDHFGFDPSQPIQVWVVEHPRATASGKVLDRVHYIGDGCHRLALMMLDGVTELREEHVQLRSLARFTPRDNTAVLLANVAVADQDYLAFVSRGYRVQPAAVSRTELLGRVPEHVVAEVEAVLDADDEVRTQRAGRHGDPHVTTPRGLLSERFDGWEENAQ